MAITKSFTAAGPSLATLLRPGQRAAVSITGTYTGTIRLEQLVTDSIVVPMRDMAGALVTATDGNFEGFVENDGPVPLRLAFRAIGTITGTAVAALTELPAGTTVARETGDAVPATAEAHEATTDVMHRTTLRVVNLPLSLVALVAQGAGLPLYVFPKGRIMILGASGQMAMITTSVLADTLNASAAAKWGVGSTTQANPTLATTEQDVLPVTALTASATVNVAGAVASAVLAAGVRLDGTVTPITLHLNVSVPAAGDIDADATVLLNGEVVLTWVNLGPY